MYDFDAMSLPFEVRRLLSHSGVRVIGILRTMCHVITDITANHRLSSRTVRVLPVRHGEKVFFRLTGKPAITDNYCAPPLG